MASRTVLLVDDELPIRSVLGRRFAACGYETLTAANGTEALEILGKARADGIVVDLQMPGMSGVEFASKVRAMEGPTPPILLLTARSHLVAPEVIAEAGIRAVAMKPFSAREIVRLVEGLLAQSGIPRGTRGAA